MPSLQREYAYYKKHQEELLLAHKGKFIVIVGEDVVATYERETDAYEEMKEKYGAGNFLIQLCVPGDQARVFRYHSRVLIP